ncbi:MAG TPA: NAD(P)H-binding protein [Puia sp.]|nr:NAD(P)H-binding protein [Puia sp.]
MKIIVFGGSGRTGVEFVRQALEKGHSVTVFVRNNHKRKQIEIAGNLSVVEGDILNPDEVRRAMRGHDIVVSTLGVSKALHHDQVVIDGVATIVKAMQKENIRRIIYVSVFLAFRKKARYGFFVNNLLRRIIRKEIDDHEVKETFISKGAHEFVIVRPVRLTDKSLTCAYVHGEDLVLKHFIPSISRADVAHFMLKQIGDTKYLNKAVIVAGGR